MLDEEVTEKLRAHLKLLEERFPGLLEERFPGLESQVAYSDRHETPAVTQLRQALLKQLGLEGPDVG